MASVRAALSAASNSRPFWIVATAVLSVGTTLWAWCWRIDHPFWSGWLTNAAVTLLLLAPGAWVVRALESVERAAGKAVATAKGAQAAAQAAAATASGAQADADALTESLSVRSEPPATPSASDVEDAVRAARVDALARQVAVFERWASRCDRASIIEAMRLAESLRLVSETGYRTQLWETTLHLRILFEDDAGSLALRVEEADTTPVGADIDWPPDRDAPEVCLAVDGLVDGAGQGLEPSMPVSIRSLRQGALALARATELRSKTWAGGDMVGEIIEFIGRLDDTPGRGHDNPGWYLTDTAMFPLSRPVYRVGVGRIHEAFWREHLAAKSWGEHSGEALEVYRALHGVRDPD